jgi:hypothetical protein
MRRRKALDNGITPAQVAALGQQLHGDLTFEDVLTQVTIGLTRRQVSVALGLLVDAGLAERKGVLTPFWRFSADPAASVQRGSRWSMPRWPVLAAGSSLVRGQR